MDPRKFSKEVKSVTIKSDIRKILDSYFPENNFSISVKTIEDNLYVFINGCDVESISNILENFLSYKIKHAYRKVKRKVEENKILYEKLYYTGYRIIYNNDCKKYYYFKYY
jgi:hypothetical protein